MNGQSRVLVVSYNSFSKENANGRTLEFLVNSFEKQNLAQLFFSSEGPDFEYCDRYYRITEKNLLYALKKRTPVGRALVKSQDSFDGGVKNATTTFGDRISGFAKRNKTSTFIKFLRNFLWKLTKPQWFNKSLQNWIAEFAPDVIFTISGKNSCFHYIALRIAKSYNLPLVVYHCEDYCYKNAYPNSLFYKAYIRGLKKSIDELMRYASLAIYNSDAIKSIYSEFHSTPHMVAYMSTDIHPVIKTHKEKELIFSYMGNLGLGRDVSLCELAEALLQIEPLAKIQVFAPNVSDWFVQTAKDLPNIEYKGFINYEECRAVMEQSDVLIHTESFDEKIKQDLKIAFSTKIADSLASGVPFFVYAPKGIASTDYLLKHGAACVATSKEELQKKLALFVEDDSLKDQYVTSALAIVKKNHTLQTTVKQIEERINGLL